ncbi:hypothetical protein LOY33_12850 [Pseudomonas sp. B21-036]|uniref:hypothetical protein n=1 Tax=unclassified Pseudomonas TaxID=196821 RepID=UPI00216060BD|nr:hypothetical protein [Pseudomonas sp. B21-036]UVL48891.1 hypothetical protein LOY33_12850 [Pseudomonas sp. B21-036]
MDENLLREIRELLENPPPRPDLDALIESGDLIKVAGGYQAPTEKGRKAIEKFVIGVALSNKGKPPVYQLSVRRKRKKAKVATCRQSALTSTAFRN